MCQATIKRLSNHLESCQVQKVASLLTEALSKTFSAKIRQMDLRKTSQSPVEASRFTSPDLSGPGSKAPLTGQATHGVVYTRPWVVELILDLVGYDPAENLVEAVAVEPSCGTGEFLDPVVRRLSESCRRQERPLRPLVITLRREDEGGLYSVPSMGDELVPCEGGGAIMDVKVRGLLPPVEGGSVDPKLLGECRFSGGVTVLLWQC